ncbi:acyltransferase [Gordonia iterans]|uniref:Acyltransferase n=1 Tax=Gordonia iterans TaxID=1004901 RepID=A0A2S0KCM5_9ACTN|nr:acyltransferase [Gordonia iterans]AVL99432.1 acyltransferase [Gordonia iterans]
MTRPSPESAGPITSSSNTPSSNTRASAKRPYLFQVDLIRATTFALVIFTHALTQTTDAFSNIGTNATTLLLHASRNIFFALTGFVLMYQYAGRDDFRAGWFWRRRMKLVIVPYILWSAVYWVVIGMWSYGRLGDVPTSLDEFWNQLKWGTAGFHLYFLLVMLQVYLLFPAIRWLVQKTKGHHGALLAASFALQIAVFAVITYWTPPESWAGWWWHHYATFVPYQFFIVAGAVAAVHREQVDAWIRGRGGWLAAGLVGTGAFAVGVYLYEAFVSGKVFSHDSAFAVTLLPFLVFAVLTIYAMGLHWATHVRPYSPRFGKAVAYASNRSFPVFLVHVLVLFLLLRPETDGAPTIVHALGQPWGTLVVYLLTIALSLGLVEVLRRLPGSVYLTGRPRLPLRWQI